LLKVLTMERRNARYDLIRLMKEDNDTVNLIYE